MIAAISISEFVLIEELHLELGPGLNVITGGSGAGKSLLVDALRFVCGVQSGGRAAGQQLVRRGASVARVAMTLAANSPPALRRAVVRALDDASAWPGGEPLVLERRISREGRTSAQIHAQPAGRPLGVKTLRRVGRVLVALFGQGEGADLAGEERQRGLVDRMAGLEERVASFSTARDAALEIAGRRERLRLRERWARDLWETQLEERALLEELAPEAEEYEALVELSARLEREGAEAQQLETLAQGLHGNEGPLERLYQLVRGLDRLQAPRLGEIVVGLREGLLALEEASQELTELVEGRGLDPREREAVRERISRYKALGRRLGLPPEALSSRWLEAQQDPAALARERQELEAELAGAVTQLDALAQETTASRKRAGSRLVRRAQATLTSLGLGGARLVLSLESVGEATAWRLAEEDNAQELVGQRFPCSTGRDRVGLLFSADAGQELGPLGRASGGELSRVFLALAGEVELGEAGSLLVFDEVDQNVGARLGAAVGERLAVSASKRQVLAVTHLAPVAVRATSHLRVSKQRGKVRVERVEGQARLRELATMIRGEPVTRAALRQASELLQEAAQPQNRRKPRGRRKLSA